MQEQTIYEEIGAENLKIMVDKFYELVFVDPLLSPLFNSDKKLIKHKQYLFLTQFLGGPDLYSQEFGHPRLRARHMPHAITEEHAVAWLKCMYAAIQELAIDEALKTRLFERFPSTAFFMVNS